ncbi:MAG: hypothetical protein R3F07_01935 [Opitutaceae bacterium]
MIVRQKDEVWFSLSRPVEGVPPYANTIWQVYRRTGDGWEVILEEATAAEREPCPLVRLNSIALAIFINPKVSFRQFRPENEAILWNSRPHLLAFPSTRRDPETFALDPVFAGDPVLREHTYRAIAVNPGKSEVFVLVQDPDSELYHPSYLDPEGRWHPLTPLGFPLRSLYASVHVRDCRVHVFAVSDIAEPVDEWREAKFRVRQVHHDYAFRRLYHTWSPDILEQGLREPLLIESVDEQPGSLRHLDLLVDGQGTAHLLYLRRDFQYPYLRDEFFPGQPMEASIVYAQIREGEQVIREILLEGLMDPDLAEAADQVEPTWGRLHQLADGTIVMIYTERVAGRNRTGLLSIGPDGLPGDQVEIDLQHPMGSVFFTNTERGGSLPSNRIDLLEMTWEKTHHEVRYAEIEVNP